MRPEYERIPDWDDRLYGWINACQRCPFSWGRMDCMMFAAGAVKAMTGADLARGHRGRYRSQASALRYLAQIGHVDVPAFLSSLLPQIPCALARRGDLVTFKGNAGVCIGSDALFLPQEGAEPGLVRLPLRAWEQAWRVG